jgi:hypothetical protein
MIKGYRDRVLAALPGTYREIAERACCSYSAAVRWMRILRGDVVHVSGWRSTTGHGGLPQPIFSLGAGKDVPCTIQKQSVSEKNARFHARLRKEGKYLDYRLRQNAHSRKRDMLLRAKTQGDPLLKALFGRGAQ